MKTVSLPDAHFEFALWDEGRVLVCGVDEVGRGPLAGPVLSAAVVFPCRFDFHAAGLSKLNDSKKLSAQQRAKLVPIILEQAISVGVGIVSPEQIDQINIRQASLLAMAEAVADLKVTPDYILVDGRDLPEGLPAAGQSIIRGDERCLTIAAASVVAKERRDEIMVGLAEAFPDYGWERNRGYPTREHREALARVGASRHHRRSFGPVRRVLAAG